MSNPTLDEKLIKIVGNHFVQERYVGSTHKALDKIKQAFADEGYMKVHMAVGDEKKLAGTGETVMTGAEWLDRFKDEITKIHPGEMRLGNVIGAARRASGLENND